MTLESDADDKTEGKMKVVFTALILFAVAGAAIADSFDYTKIKPEQYNDLKDKSEFIDKEGRTFRISNTSYEKGTYIQITVNGVKRWRKHGVFYTVMKDGWISEKHTYSFGKKDGLSETYNKKGIVKERSYYKGGRQHGSSTQFDDKGIKTMECTYENGLKQGKLYRYVDGKLHFEEDYEKGQLHGEVLQYNTSTGKLVARTHYSRGKKVGDTQWY
jgi:antitoxin component YwqK of YwqJK toxin-antitoxin module